MIFPTILSSTKIMRQLCSVQPMPQGAIPVYKRNNVSKKYRFSKKSTANMAQSMAENMSPEELDNFVTAISEDYSTRAEKATTLAEKSRLYKKAATAALSTGNASTARDYINWIATHSTNPKDKEWARERLS